MQTNNILIQSVETQCFVSDLSINANVFNPCVLFIDLNTHQMVAIPKKETQSIASVQGAARYMTSINKYLHDGESVCIGKKRTIDKTAFLSGRFWTVDTLFYSFKEIQPYFV